MLLGMVQGMALGRTERTQQGTALVPGECDDLRMAAVLHSKGVGKNIFDFHSRLLLPSLMWNLQ